MGRERAKARAAPAVTAREPGRWQPWLPAIALIALTFLVYLPATRCGFIWDDDDYVVHNPMLRSLEGLRGIWFDPGAYLGSVQFYPLVLTSFWIEYQLWGLAPAGYHVVNILIHALAAVMLWRVLGLLRLPGAWFAAAVFALHPVQVESVAWITERKNVLSAFFYLAAACAYLRWARLDELAGRGPRRWYAFALGLFVLALFSKTVACSLPAALLLVHWWKRGRLGRRELLPTLPFFAVGLALALVTVWAEKVHVGASFDLSAVERGLIAGRALWFYMAKFAWPAELVFIYPRWTIDAGAWWQYLYPASFLALLAGLFLARRRIGRGPVVGLCLFAGTLFPALGFIDVYPFLYSFVADHFQYLATIALAALVGAGWAQLSRRNELAGRALAALVLALLALLAWRQQAAYVDLESLWRDTTRKNPAAWMAHNNLGTLLYERGETIEAIERFRRATELEPTCASALVNLGTAHLSRGSPADAAESYRRALAVLPAFEDPRLTRLDAYLREQAHRYLGRVLRLLGRCDEALAELELALAHGPPEVGEHYDMAACLYHARRVPEALAHYELALALDPSALSTLRDLALILATEAEVSDPARALELAQRSQTVGGQRDPQALYALATAQAAMGQYDRAVESGERALAIARQAGIGPLVAALGEALERYRAAAGVAR